MISTFKFSDRGHPESINKIGCQNVKVWTKDKRIQQNCPIKLEFRNKLHEEINQTRKQRHIAGTAEVQLKDFDKWLL
jgi:hypothetical protein